MSVQDGHDFNTVFYIGASHLPSTKFVFSQNAFLLSVQEGHDFNTVIYVGATHLHTNAFSFNLIFLLSALFCPSRTVNTSPYYDLFALRTFCLVLSVQEGHEFNAAAPSHFVSSLCSSTKAMTPCWSYSLYRANIVFLYLPISSVYSVLFYLQSIQQYLMFLTFITRTPVDASYRAQD